MKQSEIQIYKKIMYDNKDNYKELLNSGVKKEELDGMIRDGKIINYHTEHCTIGVKYFMNIMDEMSYIDLDLTTKTARFLISKVAFNRRLYLNLFLIYIKNHMYEEAVEILKMLYNREPNISYLGKYEIYFLLCDNFTNIGNDMRNLLTTLDMEKLKKKNNSFNSFKFNCALSQIIERNYFNALYVYTSSKFEDEFDLNNRIIKVLLEEINYFEDKLYDEIIELLSSQNYDEILNLLDNGYSLKEKGLILISLVEELKRLNSGEISKKTVNIDNKKTVIENLIYTKRYKNALAFLKSTERSSKFYSIMGKLLEEIIRLNKNNTIKSIQEVLNKNGLNQIDLMIQEWFKDKDKSYITIARNLTSLYFADNTKLPFIVKALENLKENTLGEEIYMIYAFCYESYRNNDPITLELCLNIIKEYKKTYDFEVDTEQIEEKLNMIKSNSLFPKAKSLNLVRDAYSESRNTNYSVNDLIHGFNK